MKTLLVVLTVMLLATPLMAQDDSTAVNMAQVMDKLSNRAMDGLEQLAGQMGMTAEKAFPYAVQYVGAKKSVEFWVFFIPFMIFFPLLFLSIVGANSSTLEHKHKSLFVISCVGCGVCGIGSFVGIIGSLVNGVSYWIYKHAPEAATVEYLINMVK